MRFLTIYFIIFTSIFSINSTNSTKILYHNDDILIYENVIKYISSNLQVKEKLALLLNKKKLPKLYLIEGKPKFKIAKYLYENIIQNKISKCALHSNKSNETITLNEEIVNLSTDLDFRKNFLIYFSKINGNYVECRIIQNCKRKQEDSFYTNTRFGKILTLQMCIEDNIIADIEINLVTAN